MYIRPKPKTRLSVLALYQSQGNAIYLYRNHCHLMHSVHRGLHIFSITPLRLCILQHTLICLPEPSRTPIHLRSTLCDSMHSMQIIPTYTMLKKFLADQSSANTSSSPNIVKFIEKLLDGLTGRLSGLSVKRILFYAMIVDPRFSYDPKINTKHSWN